MTNPATLEVATRVLATTPRLGAVRLLVIDGPAGSGKTTYAAALGAALGGAPVIHMDDLYEGWDGLGHAVFARIEAQILAPLRARRAARYQRYDWLRGAFAEWIDVPPPGVLLLEGVGAAAAPIDPSAVLRVWVEAPRELRFARGVERDGEALRDRWRRWAEQEAAHFAADGTRARAEVIIDGTRTL